MRLILTFVALADTALAVQIMLVHRHHYPHRAYASAGEAALGTLGSTRLFGAIVLAVAALYLATRPKRAFHRILLLLTLVAAFLATLTSQPALLAIAAIDGVAAALAASLWPEIGDRVASRLGGGLLVGGGGAVAWLFLLQNPPHQMLSLFVGLLMVAFIAMLTAVALLDRNPVLPCQRDRTAASRLCGAHAATSAAAFALMSDKRQFWASDGRAFLGLGCRMGVALAMGPGVGEPGVLSGLYHEFRAACRLRGWKPALYQVDEATANAVGGTRLRIGDEALVGLDNFDLAGAERAKLRRMVARARRAEIRVEVIPETEVSAPTARAIADLARAARTRSPLGEMTFSVGGHGQPADVDRTLALAWSPEGRLLAYATWLWLPTASLVVLDELKRAAGAPPGTVDLMLTDSLHSFRGAARRASLGLVPLGGSGAARRAGMWLAQALGLGGLSAGLVSFKAKYAPAWEPRYLVVDRHVDLPAVALATLLLHYPALGRVSGPIPLATHSAA